jgi:DNA methyltransferase 1-associated protein 1
MPVFSDRPSDRGGTADGWTREETDHLFELARTYDLRFIVMADRWLDSSFSERTIEDLKERYYDCCRKLILARPASDESSKGSLANTYAFDKSPSSAPYRWRSALNRPCRSRGRSQGLPPLPHPPHAGPD